MTTTLSDPLLLADFLRHRSQSAFTVLVHRYGSLLYSAALRQTRDPHLAEDITQAVFLLLAKKAPSLARRRSLAGWLMLSTRFAAKNAIKLRARRARHEQEAAAMTLTIAAPSFDASDLLPHLDDALARLSDTDRTLILLRFFQNQPILDISATLALSPDAAKKRLARALAKLRRLFAARGLTLSAAALALALPAIPLHAMPPLLAAAVNPLSAPSPAGALIVRAVLRHAVAAKLALAGAVAACLTAVLVAAAALPRPALPATTAPITDTQPATAPAQFITPLQTILALSDSWANNSPDAYDKVHTTGNADEQAYAAAVRTLLAAQQRTIDAWRKTLDPADTSAFPPAALYIKGITNDQVRAIRVIPIDDQHAQVDVPGLLRYSLVKDQGLWKTQIQATIGTRYTDSAKATQLLTAMFHDLADLYAQTSDRINAGQLRTLPSITQYLQERGVQIFAAHTPALNAISLIDP